MTKPMCNSVFTIVFLLFTTITLSQTKKILRKALKETNPAKQIELYNKVIEIDNKNLDAYFYRGVAKANLGDHNGAILDFTKVIFFEPNGDTFYNRGNSKFELGDFKGANEDYKEAIKMNRGLLIKATFNIGLTHFYLGDYFEALSSFSHITKINPRHVGANLQMALTLMELGYQKRAMLYFDKSVTLDKNTYTLYHRGLAHLELKHYKKANYDLSLSVRMDKKNKTTYFYLGISQLFCREYKEANSSFEKSLKFNALDHDALIGSAIANYHLKNYEKSKTYFKKAKGILHTQNKGSRDDKSIFKDSFWNKNEADVFSAYFEKLNSL